jgi:hypothetical protein
MAGPGNTAYRKHTYGQRLARAESIAFRQSLERNSHVVAIISVDEFDAMVRHAPASHRSKAQDLWNQVRSKAEFGANWYSTGSDVRTLLQLVNELGIAANQIYVRNYAGKPHIILNGYVGNRAILTTTHYGATHPKMITLGIGRAAVQNVVRSGGVLTIQLVTAYRILDYFLTDNHTLTQLLGSLATDVVKVGISVGVGLAVEALVATSTTLASIAVAPLAVVIGVGIGVSLLLNDLDQQYGFTTRLIEELDRLEATGQQAISGALSEYLRAQTRRLMWVPRF